MTHSVDYGNTEDDDLTEPLDGRDSQAPEGSSDNPELLDEVDPLHDPRRLIELDVEEEPNPDIDLGYD
ncbi:hypothetical protein SPF06_20910 [Sinomonas sp. JGH33]|uniref:Uncharacterized protein n=1 Tax=Sinomonas terricola TaxID=3110330 RepID=A0ABU5TBX0_9MICC|nr:hypothetical protein [Sinomonas sp. JGH33]MEA5457189.1 hypothetical protein [Sinomonas sp. JGH33]